jgi:ABC-type multidrug transport system fused ATPase/permease subunit
VKHFPKVLAYLRPYWKLAVVSVILMLLGALAGLLAPWPLQFLVDQVLQGKPLPPALQWALGAMAANRMALLIAAVVAGLAVALLQNGLTVLDNYVNTKIDQSMVLDFRSDLFQHAQRLSMTFHDQRRSGSLIYAINFQADAASRLIMAIPPLVQSILTLAGMFWIVLLIDRRLALLSITVVPLLYYAVRYYIKHIQHQLLDVKGKEAESLSIIHEAMSMLRVIVAFGRENYEHRRFRTQGQHTINARINLTVRQTLFSLAVNMTTALGTALVLGLGAYHVIEGRLTVGQLLVVLSYIALVYKPLETISTTTGSLQDVFIALRIAFDLLDQQPEIKDLPGATPVGHCRGRLAFEHLHFNYPTRRETLTDIAFQAEPGQVIAVVGPTGAGKTTLVSLIPRFYDPSRGRITLDGVDVRELTLKSLREQISIVLQEPLLFSGTIADNIRYGRLDADREAVVEAARAANAHEFIVKLPCGYETELGERGARLSGGERQRIAVARAFLKRAPILILDEPTSSIDSKTEAIILDALDRVMAGRTTFLIAHRLSTIRRADLILVVDRGRLVEQGSHEKLMQLRGLYREMYEMQMRPAGRKLLHNFVAEPQTAIEGPA